jgi:hypothetical protein
MKVRPDKTWANQTAASIDLFIYGSGVSFSYIGNTIAFENDNTTYKHFVFCAIESNNVPPLNKSLHSVFLLAYTPSPAEPAEKAR